MRACLSPSLPTPSTVLAVSHNRYFFHFHQCNRTRDFLQGIRWVHRHNSKPSAWRKEFLLFKWEVRKLLDINPCRVLENLEQISRLVTTYSSQEASGSLLIRRRAQKGLVAKDASSDRFLRDRPRSTVQAATLVGLQGFSESCQSQTECQANATDVLPNALPCFVYGSRS